MINRIILNALQLAQTSNHPTHRLACILTYKNKIIVKGTNSGKTHPHAPLRFKEGSKLEHQSHHAEFNVLKKLDGDWVRGKNKQPLYSHIRAYVVRLRADGTPAMARPCENCIKMFKAYGIKEVVYTTSSNMMLMRENL